MNKVIAIVVVIIIIAGGAWALTRGKNNNSSMSGMTGSQNSVSNKNSASNTNTSPVATDKVAIQNFAFSPGSITVKKGTQVTWTNQDSVAHTVTENDGKNGPSAPPLNQGQSYSFTFNQTGTFHYHCSIHPDMTGTVTVTD